MQLSPRQKRYLRGLGHTLKPVVMVGTAGMTPGVIAELDGALEHHELVKIRVRSGGRSDRDSLISALCQKTSSELVQRVGHMALLYRPDPDRPGIRLPPA